MIARRYQRIAVICVFFWVIWYFFWDMPSIRSETLLKDGFRAAKDYATGNDDARKASVQDNSPQKQGTLKVGGTTGEEAERPTGAQEKELVVASMRGDDTSWLDEWFGNWTKNVYVVNDPSAALTVARNKGREAMPFLTYIINRYDSLPDVSIFIHSLRYQWHNEDPMYDGVPVLQRLRLKHVQERGFVALRCSWTMGCPSELHPTNPSTATDDRSQNEQAWGGVFKQLFPGEEVPHAVGAHCSSQFAVSRERIHARPKSKYEEIKQWLLETKLEDAISGRVIEYMWHMIFGMPAVDCQHAGECFCQTFGLCNLTCSESGCEKRYILPQYATIPQGWPEIGPGSNGWPAKGWAD